MSFDALPDSVLPEIFTHVTPGLLLQLSTVSKRFAAACEQNFQRHCNSNGWAAPRMPRGAAAKRHCFPQRAEYRRHACISCGEPGEFNVRPGNLGGTKQAPVAYLICKRCAKLPEAQSRLVAGSLYVDLMSISGTKRLIDKPVHRKGIKRRIKS